MVSVKIIYVFLVFYASLFSFVAVTGDDIAEVFSPVEAKDVDTLYSSYPEGVNVNDVNAFNSLDQGNSVTKLITNSNLIMGFSSVPWWLNTVVFAPIGILIAWILVINLVPTLGSGN